MKIAPALAMARITSIELRGGYTQQRETSSFLDLETSFLVHICILGQNGEKNANIFFYPLGPPSDPDFLPKFAPKFYLKVLNPHKRAKFDFFLNRKNVFEKTPIKRSM